ncbi:hypothetical protein VY86_20770 [Photorhabdus thracensis]|uniref:Uncharacterized protein n=1 Tax=Photorhabdus thracensis TaxID=230089 RepID=A0A0F7LU68_9GAMM|nr:hypothetical protein VY86_20770 [Photorhabdus thracensis]
MNRQKAVIKSRREAKRMMKKDLRHQRYRDDDNVTSLVQLGGIEAIGIAFALNCAGKRYWLTVNNHVVNNPRKYAVEVFCV